MENLLAHFLPILTSCLFWALYNIFFRYLFLNLGDVEGRRSFCIDFILNHSLLMVDVSAWSSLM